jgi:hypothetical protein
MNGASVTDLLLRSIAAMRERGELPEFEPPMISVARLTGSDPARFHCNAGQALAAGQTGDQPRLSPQDLAHTIANYLREVVDLVPAYHDVAAVEASDDGSLTITLRGPETP